MAKPQRKKTSLNLSKTAKDRLSLLKYEVRAYGKLPDGTEITESAILEALILAATQDYVAAQLKKTQKRA